MSIRILPKVGIEIATAFEVQFKMPREEVHNLLGEPSAIRRTMMSNNFSLPPELWKYDGWRIGIEYHDTIEQVLAITVEQLVHSQKPESNVWLNDVSVFDLKATELLKVVRNLDPTVKIDSIGFDSPVLGICMYCNDFEEACAYPFLGPEFDYFNPERHDVVSSITLFGERP